jgi:hypothetical protein
VRLAVLVAAATLPFFLTAGNLSLPPHGPAARFPFCSSSRQALPFFLTAGAGTQPPPPFFFAVGSFHSSLQPAAWHLSSLLPRGTSFPSTMDGSCSKGWGAVPAPARKGCGIELLPRISKINIIDSQTIEFELYHFNIMAVLVLKSISMSCPPILISKRSLRGWELEKVVS